MRALVGRVAYVALVGLVIVAALALLLHLLRFEPARQPGIGSDALGPENGIAVEEYLDAAAATLEPGAGGADSGDPHATRWALVSFDDPMAVDDAAGAVEGVDRVSRMIVQSPREGLAMPVDWLDVPEPVGAGREEVFQRELARLADRDPGAQDPAGERSRAEDLAALSAGDIDDGWPVLIGLVVRGTTDALRGVADADGVRAVEALPGDASWGRFAVRPLLPQHTDVVAPLPDDGEIPGPAGR